MESLQYESQVELISHMNCKLSCDYICRVTYGMHCMIQKWKKGTEVRKSVIAGEAINGSGKAIRIKIEVFCCNIFLEWDRNN